ncbi:MAG: hypothetical protein NDI82_08900, partial [Anaeromyxobacteraceae bacterium]|nr:hypothetical protein [Anaeromyxobacteraceae bacterium]
THRVLARSQLQEGDVLFSIAGALGRTTTVPAGLAQANINQAVALIRIAEGRAVPAFVAYALRASEVRKQIAYLGAKQAQANLSLQQLGTLRISLPSVDRQREVVAALSAIDERLFAEYRTYDASVALKTALAEALLSGKLRVLAQDPA